MTQRIFPPPETKSGVPPREERQTESFPLTGLDTLRELFEGNLFSPASEGQSRKTGEHQSHRGRLGNWGNRGPSVGIAHVEVVVPRDSAIAHIVEAHGVGN